jgi:hypothetical protein
MNTDAQSGGPAVPGAADQGETAPAESLASAVNVFEVAPPAQEITLEESITGQVSRAQPLASPGATGLQDCPSSPGAHSFTKSVGAFALESARLKSSFAHLLLPRWYAWRCRTVDFFMTTEAFLENRSAYRPFLPHARTSLLGGTTNYKSKILTTCEQRCQTFLMHTRPPLLAQSPPLCYVLPCFFTPTRQIFVAAGRIHERRRPVPSHRPLEATHLCLSLAHP